MGPPAWVALVDAIVLASQRKHRQSYLRALLGQLAPEQHEGLAEASMWNDELRRCEWLCHSLANMPYEKENDVLEMIFQSNRMLSLHADRRLQEAAGLLNDANHLHRIVTAEEGSPGGSQAGGAGVFHGGGVDLHDDKETVPKHKHDE